MVDVHDGDDLEEAAEAEEITFDRIIATGNHPFWVVAGPDLEDRPESEELDQAERSLRTEAGSRWVDARWLRLGDQFLTRSGQSATIVGLTIRIEREIVYNLEVRGLHNFAVGAAGVLVHNRACSKRLGRNMAGSEDAARRMRARGYHARHIVPGKLRSRELRKRMRRFGIDINDPANGVWLPGRYHKTIHTNRYMEELERILLPIRDRRTFEDRLRHIGRQLQDGTFPIIARMQ